MALTSIQCTVRHYGRTGAPPPSGCNMWRRAAVQDQNGIYPSIHSLGQVYLEGENTNSDGASGRQRRQGGQWRAWKLLESSPSPFFRLGTVGRRGDREDRHPIPSGICQTKHPRSATRCGLVGREEPLGMAVGRYQRPSRVRAKWRGGDFLVEGTGWGGLPGGKLKVSRPGTEGLGMRADSVSVL